MLNAVIMLDIVTIILSGKFSFYENHNLLVKLDLYLSDSLVKTKHLLVCEKFFNCYLKSCFTFPQPFKCFNTGVDGQMCNELFSLFLSVNLAL